jgi:D-3-phosphoglycerate dehydrogenase
MSTLTVGIVGYGRIGQRTAQKLRGFGCRVLAHSRSAQSTPLEELLQNSDVVILHVPLTPDTRHLINSARLALMRSGALLVNVSRGAVVDTSALIAALESGHLSGAALDDLEHEPQVPVALSTRTNVMLTPHVAFSSGAALAELRQSASEEVVRVLCGERPRQPRNLIAKGAS